MGPFLGIDWRCRRPRASRCDEDGRHRVSLYFFFHLQATVGTMVQVWFGKLWAPRWANSFAFRITTAQLHEYRFTDASVTISNRSPPTLGRRGGDKIVNWETSHFDDGIDTCVLDLSNFNFGIVNMPGGSSNYIAELQVQVHQLRSAVDVSTGRVALRTDFHTLFFQPLS